MRFEDHGDHIIITSPKCGNGGGLIMLGRSDGVLCVPILTYFNNRRSLNASRRNPGGVRFGSAELYEVLDLCFTNRNAEDVVLDYVAVGQKMDGGADERVVLFIKLALGQELSPAFEARIKSEIRGRLSPRHVPWRVCLFFFLTNMDFVMLNLPYTDYTSIRYPLYLEWKTGRSPCEEGVERLVS